MRLWILAMVAVVALSACGKSEQQKQAEQAAEDLKKAAETMAAAAEKQGTAAAAQGANDMAKAMQSMASALSTGSSTSFERCVMYFSSSQIRTPPETPTVLRESHRLRQSYGAA